MSDQTPLFEIQVPSTQLVGEPRFEDHGARALLTYEYLDGAARKRGFIEFRKLRAYRKRAEVHCTKWHIEDAYDTLVEVSNSAWSEEIRNDTADGWKTEWTLKHYMIYLDSAGAYEMLADSWSTGEEAA